MSYNLYLDDVRNPADSFAGGPYLFPGNRIYVDKQWTVVRNYNDFVAKIYSEGLPDTVSFDHDLADEHMQHYFTKVVTLGADPSKESFKEKTGYDAALFLLNYVEQNNLLLPEYHIHSFNPAGAKAIKELLSDYERYNFEGVSKDFVEHKTKQRENIMKK